MLFLDTLLHLLSIPSDRAKSIHNCTVFVFHILVGFFSHSSSIFSICISFISPSINHLLPQSSQMQFNKLIVDLILQLYSYKREISSRKSFTTVCARHSKYPYIWGKIAIGKITEVESLISESINNFSNEQMRKHLQKFGKVLKWMTCSISLTTFQF